MDALVQPCELHLDGGEQDLIRMAQSLTAEVVEVGPNAHRMSMDNEWASGYALSLGLPYDMRMTVQDFHGRSALRLPIRHGPTALEFSFCRGRGVNVRTNQGQKLNFCGAQLRVGCVNETTLLEYEAEANANEHSIHINLGADSLRALLSQDELPANIATLMMTPGPLNFLEAGMDRAILALTDEVFEIASQATGANRRGASLSLHAKAFELVSLAIERAADLAMEDVVLPEYDIRCLNQARTILMDNLDSPPHVAELARRVGLGEKRLKAGFKTLFGSPVMSYHRRLKLERARELLVARAHNVTEVANLIGYANPSKFAAAYRREFGQSPRFALTGSD